MASTTIYPTGAYPTDRNTLQTALDDGYDDILLKATDVSGNFTVWKIADRSSYPAAPTDAGLWMLLNDAYAAILTDVTLHGEDLSPLGDSDGDPLQTTIDGGSIFIGAAQPYTPATAFVWPDVTISNLNFINALGGPIMALGGANVTVQDCKMSKIVPAYNASVAFAAGFGILGQCWSTFAFSIFNTWALDWTDNAGLATADPFLIQLHAVQRELLDVKRCIFDLAPPLGITQAMARTGVYPTQGVASGRNYGLAKVDSCEFRNSSFSAIMLEDHVIPYGTADSGSQCEVTNNTIELVTDDSYPHTFETIYADGYLPVMGVAVTPRAWVVLGRGRKTLVRNNTITYAGDKPVTGVLASNSNNVTITNNRLRLKGLGEGTLSIDVSATNQSEYGWLLLSFLGGFNHLADYVPTYRNGLFAGRTTMENVSVVDNVISSILAAGVPVRNWNFATFSPFGYITLPTYVDSVAMSGNQFQDCDKGRVFYAHYSLDSHVQNSTVTVAPSDAHEVLVVDNGDNTVNNALRQRRPLSG